MSENCFNNPVIRDGTSQQMRLIKSLLPEYVAVDERDFEELKRFVLDFSKELQFYDNSNSPSGNWYDFFAQKIKQDQRTQPHYALFQAFLELFAIAQADMNTLTGRHLDYYYMEVLRLREKAPVPDQVFVIFELAKHVTKNGHLIEEGTALAAGKDELGNDVIYRTTQDIVINKAQVSEVKGLYKDPDSSRIYHSAVANSSDGTGGEIESDSGSWLPFGSNLRTASDIGFSIATPLLYLAEGTRTIKITLTFDKITTAQRNQLSAFSPGELSQIFDVWFSGEKNWIYPQGLDEVPQSELNAVTEKRIVTFINEKTKWEEIAGDEPAVVSVADSSGSGYEDQLKGYSLEKTVAQKIIDEKAALSGGQFTSLSQIRSVTGLGADKVTDMQRSFRNTFTNTLFDYDNNTLCLVRTISRDQEPIVGYNAKKLEDPLNTSLPVAKILLNTDPDVPYIYDSLKELKIKTAKVSVDVADVADLLVRNDQTVMDPAKTIQPFGIQPVLGANFFIGSHEVFQKQLNYLKLNLEWYGLPTDPLIVEEKDINGATNNVTYQGFDAHYRQYIKRKTNTSFKANVSVLDKKNWIRIGENINLFADQDNEALDPLRSVEFVNNTALASVERDVDMQTFRDLDTGTKKGFIRLELTGSDFSHKDFPASFTKRVLEGLDDAGVQLPRDPYTPLLERVTLDYRSEVCINFMESSVPDCEEQDDKVEQYFRMTPFGAHEVAIYDPGTVFFLPQHNNEGEFYIGLDNLSPPQNISILFQILEGSENPQLAKPELTWEYLTATGWKEFEQTDILSDSTNGLIRSGLINFAVPKDAISANTILTDGLHWLRVSVTSDAAAIPEFIAVAAQAISARFEDNNNDPDYLASALAAGTISKLEFSDSAVKKLVQPFASFGGKTKEKSTAFYTRVSERLRHKQRAITIWDYERLVLEEFPSIYKVKCLNHTRYRGTLDDFSDVVPGEVSLVVVSNVQNRNAVDPIRPLTSLNTLTEIGQFLDQYRAPALTLNIQNPVYEGIKVDFKVKFRDGYDVGFYKRQLEDEIKAFLSPWAYDQSPDIVFGGKIHQSMILNFVDEREYVDFVTCFKMFHPKASLQALSETSATTSASILCSVGQVSTYGDHLIEVIESRVDCDQICDDNIVDPPPVILSADTCTSEMTTPDEPEEDDPYDYSIPDDTLCPPAVSENECDEWVDDSDDDDPEVGGDDDDEDNDDVDDEPDIDGDDDDPDIGGFGDGELIGEDDADNDSELETNDDKFLSLSFGYMNDSNLFDTYKDTPLIKNINTTYVIPKTVGYMLGAEISEIIDERTFTVKGDVTGEGYNRLENVTIISGGFQIGTKELAPVYKNGFTTVTVSNKDHDFEAGDRLTFFRIPTKLFSSVYLPKANEDMVDNEAIIAIQLIGYLGNTLVVKPYQDAQKDRLRTKEGGNSTELSIVLKAGSPTDTFSVCLKAIKEEADGRISAYGWEVVDSKQNYISDAIATEPENYPMKLKYVRT